MMLMLICADYVAARAANSVAAPNPYFDPYQTIASLLFAIAFVMFVGFAGFLSDRYPKKRIVVCCKVAEIVVMLLGFLVLLMFDAGTAAYLVALFAVLFLMGLQSAFFGPSKFGILPEMFSDTDLPTINGVILATTFLAIIFGTVLAGALKDVLGDRLWMISLLCVGLACLGTLTSLMLRRPAAAQSSLRFSVSNWFGEPRIWKQVTGDRLLFKVLLVYSVFWFVGGVIALTITLFGRIQLQLPDIVTAGFNACMGLGIGMGSIWAAKISHKDVRLDLVKSGSLGMFVGLLVVSLVAILGIPLGVKCWLIGIALFAGGFFGGWVAVPLQVFIQAHPADELKGRIIAVMNLMTWIGILLASVYYFAALWVTGFRMNPSWIVLSAGVIILLAGGLPTLKTEEHLRDERAEAAAIR